MKESYLVLYCTHCTATVSVGVDRRMSRRFMRMEDLNPIIPCCNAPRFNWGMGIEGNLLPYFEVDTKENRFDTVIKNTHKPGKTELIDTPNALIVDIEN